MNTATPRLVRSRTDRVIAGVAGGVARYLAVDPTLVRLVFVALVFTGVGVLLYPLLWLIMPLEDGSGSVAERASGELREVFVAGGAARRPRINPMTGAPQEPEAEIPINNLDADEAPADGRGRNTTLGYILVGAGAFLLLSVLIGPAFGKLLFPLLLIGVGVVILRRSR